MILQFVKLHQHKAKKIEKERKYSAKEQGLDISPIPSFRIYDKCCNHTCQWREISKQQTAKHYHLMLK